LLVMMPRFDVVLSYDLGNGIRVERGGETFSQWPAAKETPELPKSPRVAVEFLTRYFRYCANLARLGKGRIQAACLVNSANLLAPALPGAFNYDLNSLALLMRDWASEALLSEHTLVTCLITENLNDLHPLLVTNSRAARIKIPLPEKGEIETALRTANSRYETALAILQTDPANPAPKPTGAPKKAINSLLK